MPKPSGTNNPKAFREERSSRVFPAESAESYFWWLWSECPPLPIPNREVKPHIADDTAPVRGKVGRRQPLQGSRERLPFFVAFGGGVVVGVIGVVGVVGVLYF